jgi:hypothetical protein
VRAALRGIDYAAANIEEALDIVLGYAPEEDREHQRYMLETELQMAATLDGSGAGPGYQTLAQWQSLHDYLVAYGGLPGPIEDVSRVFTEEFLEE